MAEAELVCPVFPTKKPRHRHKCPWHGSFPWTIRQTEQSPAKSRPCEKPKDFAFRFRIASALLPHCVSYPDSASSDRAFLPFSEKRRCKKTYFFRNPLAKSEEICYTTFGRRLSGCIGVPRTLMQVCHIAVWQTAFFLRSHYSLKKHFCQPVFENYFGFFEKFFQRVFQEKPFMKNICLYKVLFRRFSRKVFRKSLAKSRKLCYSIPGRRLSGCMDVPRTPVQVCHAPTWQTAFFCFLLYKRAL